MIDLFQGNSRETLSLFVLKHHKIKKFELLIEVT